MSVGTMASLFVGIAVSLLVGLMGVYIGDGMVTGNPSLLHVHHCAKTRPDDLLRLAHWCGLGMTAAGVGFTLLTVGTAAVYGDSLPAWAGSAVILAPAITLCTTGMVTTFASIIHYNGSLLSNVMRKMRPSSSPLERRIEWA